MMQYPGPKLPPPEPDPLWAPLTSQNLKTRDRMYLIRASICNRPIDQRTYRGKVSGPR
jgi:hypothetical protein